MPEFLRKHWAYLIGAVLLHVVFVGVFGLTMLKFARKPPPAPLAIQAVVVDRSVIDRAARQQERDRAKEREQQRQQQEAEQRKQEERREAEQKAEQQREQEQKQREDQQRRVVEEQQAREKQETERKAQAEAQAENQRKAQVEADRQRKAEEDRKRVAEIERKQKEEAERRKAAEDARAQQQREDELRKQLESEEGENEAKNSDAYALNVFQGGIGTFSQYLAKGLHAIGHDVSLYSRYDRTGTWNTLSLWGAGRSPAKLQIPYLAAGLYNACASHRPGYIVSTHLNFGPVACGASEASECSMVFFILSVSFCHSHVHPGDQHAVVVAERASRPNRHAWRVEA